jgi:GntR family galactonate operon transcriptional repressor
MSIASPSPRLRSKALNRSLRAQLVEAIGSEIGSGQLKPGECLPSEGVLLARYDVSRTVLRDALNVLSGKGLLDPRPKRGTVVRPRSEWSLLDSEVLTWRGSAVGKPEDVELSLDRLMEVRRVIEPAAAGLAALRGTSEDFARLTSAYEAMEQAGDDAGCFMEADLAFHVACLRASQNEFLLPVAHAIRTAMMTSLRITNRNPEENRSVSLPLHRAIVYAVLTRDSATAKLAMERHLDDTERRRLRARVSNHPT